MMDWRPDMDYLNNTKKLFDHLTIFFFYIVIRIKYGFIVFIVGKF